ncbi:hypothetical protein A2Y99_04560 [Candidatus Gottesmanbacteria bacterium RBG_13_37_7]|uniref:Thioredoxin domain-containing protein n=1 Tax=Candidatus Gottesmanbacteria bacterium RBG_13_37_7 TaxID=1798369 RepID=A0A1F5YGN9_9BACT|nr:MAG: hypothetical protein A2Y99_04560 [Candidatus Gottesmanbacteria bacterium RBG_13_37_7]
MAESKKHKEHNTPKESKTILKTNKFLVTLLIGAVIIIGVVFYRVSKLEKNFDSAKDKIPTVQKAKPTEVSKIDIKVTTEDASMGPTDAKVTVALFSDFICPFCGAFSGESSKMMEIMKSRDSSWVAPLPNMINDYIMSGKSVRIVWKDMPFHGEEAILVHAAAKCAQEQNKFWEYHNSLFAKLGSEGEDVYSKENLEILASSIELNSNEFNSCLESGRYQTKMKEALAYGQSIGVDGTPATFINGRFVSGAGSYPQFKALIDEELSK